jgi:hypothetical protein
MCQGQNWRYRELLLESHPPPWDERGEGADSGEPPGASLYYLPAGVHYPHYGHHGDYDGCNNGYYGHHEYYHGDYKYNHGYYHANHRHSYCYRGHDGWANRDDHHHHRRYHIGAGYHYTAEHDGGADQTLPVHRLPDGKRIS